MDLYQKLVILNCVASLLTLLMVATAVLPHIKQGMVLVRDAILWAAFVAFISGLAWMGWQRMSAGGLGRPTSTVRPAAVQAADVPSKPAGWLDQVSTRTTDPYYVGASVE